MLDMLKVDRLTRCLSERGEPLAVVLVEFLLTGVLAAELWRDGLTKDFRILERLLECECKERRILLPFERLDTWLRALA